MIEEKINMEEKILEAAEELFLQKGFGLTSTTEIAAKAGCNQALVHYYYRTKGNLFERIFNKKMKLFISVFTEFDNSNIRFEDRIKQTIELYFEFLCKNPKLPYLFLSELTTNPQRAEGLKSVAKGVPEIILKKIDKELEKERALGNIREIKAIDFIINIVSPTIFLFIAKPMINLILSNDDENFFDDFVQSRKQEIIETIIRSLKP